MARRRRLRLILALTAARSPSRRPGRHLGLRRSRGVEVQPEQVVITPGAKPIMFFAILALLNPGDEAIYPDPGFPIYQSMINFVGAKPVPLPLREEKNFRFDPDEFRSLVTDRTRLIILNSPQNPTGGVLTRQDLEVIAEVIQGRNIMVLSDEVYEQILYEARAIQAVSHSEIRRAESTNADPSKSAYRSKALIVPVQPLSPRRATRPCSVLPGSFGLNQTQQFNY